MLAQSVEGEKANYRLNTMSKTLPRPAEALNFYPQSFRYIKQQTFAPTDSLAHSYNKQSAQFQTIY